MARALLFDLGGYSIGRKTIGGIGLRAVELAETLAAAPADPPRMLLFAPGAEDPIATGAAEIIDDSEAWPTLLGEADVVFFFDLPARSRLEDAVAARRLIVTENAAPIEHLEYPRFLTMPSPAEHHQGLLSTYRRQLEVSHHFLIRSGVERVALLANLCLAGRLSPADVVRSRTLEPLTSLVPLGFSQSSAEAARRSPSRPIADFVWTGGLWVFYDPEMFIRAVALCRERGHQATAAFLYGQEEEDNTAILARMRALIQHLGVESAVRIVREPPAHDERDAWLKGARGYVCIGRPGIENETCVRLRIRDSRLYGVPLIVDRHGGTAGELAADGLARVLQRDTPEDLADLLITCLSEQPVGTLESYSYSRTLGKFQQWLAEQC